MWLCSCGMHNPGIFEICVNNRFYGDCQQISANTADWWMYSRDLDEILALRKDKGMSDNDDEVIAPLTGAALEAQKEAKRKSEAEFYENQRKQLEENKTRMTPQEELFKTYYIRGKHLVKDMDDSSLREHIEELQKIATEAKATLLAATDEKRERGARKSLKDKEWLVSTDDEKATRDAINVVEKRKARMTKMDKLQSQLLAAGIEESVVKDMVKNLERKATDKSLKTITFQKKTEETAVVQVKAEPNNSEPFDPSKITFG